MLIVSCGASSVWVQETHMTKASGFVRVPDLTEPEGPVHPYRNSGRRRLVWWSSCSARGLPPCGIWILPVGARCLVLALTPGFPVSRRFWARTRPSGSLWWDTPIRVGRPRHQYRRVSALRRCGARPVNFRVWHRLSCATRIGLYTRGQCRQSQGRGGVAAGIPEGQGRWVAKGINMKPGYRSVGPLSAKACSRKSVKARTLG